MRLVRFTEAELMARASTAHEYFVERPAEKVFHLHAKAEEDFVTYNGSYPTEMDAPPILEIKRPQAMMGPCGLGEAIKAHAAYWNIFNQLLQANSDLPERVR